MRVIKLDDTNVVIRIRNNVKDAKEDEIESLIGELGQRMLEDGTFVDVPIEPIESQPTIEERILAENQYQTMLLELTTMGGM